MSLWLQLLEFIQYRQYYWNIKINKWSTQKHEQVNHQKKLNRKMENYL